MNEHLEPDDQQSADDAQQAKSALREQRDIDDFKWVMADARGRRFIARLLERTGTMRTSFHTGSLVMAFNEGRRDIGLFLTAEALEHTPKAYSQLLNEFRNDNRNR